MSVGRRYRWVEGIYGWRRRLRESGWRDIVPAWAELLLGGAAGVLGAEVAIRSRSELGILAGALVGMALVSAIVEARRDRPSYGEGLATWVSLVVGIVGAAIAGGCASGVSNAPGPFSNLWGFVGAVLGYPWIPLIVRDRPRSGASGVLRGALSFIGLGCVAAIALGLAHRLPARVCFAAAGAFLAAGMVAAFRVAEPPPTPKK